MEEIRVEKWEDLRVGGNVTEEELGGVDLSLYEYAGSES
jgi:hypothetical protein